MVRAAAARGARLPEPLGLSPGDRQPHPGRSPSADSRAGPQQGQGRSRRRGVWVSYLDKKSLKTTFKKDAVKELQNHYRSHTWLLLAKMQDANEQKCLPLSRVRLCDPKDSSLPGSSPRGSPGRNTGVGCRVLLQGSSWPRDQPHDFHVSCTGGQVLYHQDREPWTEAASGSVTRFVYSLQSGAEGALGAESSVHVACVASVPHRGDNTANKISSDPKTWQGTVFFLFPGIL